MGSIYTWVHTHMHMFEVLSVEQFGQKLTNFHINESVNEGQGKTLSRRVFPTQG